MNKRPLIDRLLDKWPAKIICLIIAIFLYIFHQASLIDKKTYTIPLSIEENGIVTHVGNAPNSVSVVVRAESNDMKSILHADMHAYVTLDSITEKGVYTVPVYITLSEKLMELDPFEIRIKNPTVNIEVDKKAQKYVQLKPSIVGTVAHGFQITEVTINPSTILVSGPETVLKAVESFETKKINVSNAETTFSTETECLDFAKLIEIEDEGPYKVTIVVKPMDYEKEFTNIQPEILGLADHLELSEEVPSISVKLAGTMPNLEEYNLKYNFAQLDFYDIQEPGEYDIPVKYNVPSIFEMVEKSTDFITVIIREKKELTEETEEIINNAEMQMKVEEI